VVKSVVEDRSRVSGSRAEDCERRILKKEISRCASKGQSCLPGTF